MHNQVYFFVSIVPGALFKTCWKINHDTIMKTVSWEKFEKKKPGDTKNVFFNRFSALSRNSDVKLNILPTVGTARRNPRILNTQFNSQTFLTEKGIIKRAANNIISKSCNKKNLNFNLFTNTKKGKRTTCQDGMLQFLRDASQNRWSKSDLDPFHNPFQTYKILPNNWPLRFTLNDKQW